VGHGLLGFEDGYLDPDDDVLWNELDVEGGGSVQCSFSPRSCDGGWPKSKEWIGGAHDGSRHLFPSELYTDFFFVILLLLNTFLLATAGTRIS
jgi:hypothetical protein